MIKLIKKVLAKYPEVEWVINEKKVSSYELFFVHRNLQMNRDKDVTHYKLTVYVKDGEMKGNATISIHPTMKEEEVKKAIDEAIYAAQFAKNPTFKLAEPKELPENKNVSNMESKKLKDLALDIAEAVFKADDAPNCFLNATEVFVNREERNVYNSSGVAYKSSSTNGQVEYITTYKGEDDEYELYRFLEFTDFNPRAIQLDVEKQIEIARYRAEAKPMREFKNINVVFNTLEIGEIMSYFLQKTNVSAIYMHQSDWKVGAEAQAEGPGDKLNLTIDPFQVGSTEIGAFDSEGNTNERVDIIKDGKVTALWGPNKFGQYLKYDSKVNNWNIEVGTGSLSTEELESEPYLEIVALSGLQVDEVTGSFGSEIRLALYHDKGEITPYSASSINGFIGQHSGTWKFSKEKVQVNHYHGPKYLLLKGVDIFGIK